MDESTKQILQKTLENTYKSDLSAFLKDIEHTLQATPATRHSDPNAPVIIDLKNISRQYKLGRRTVQAVKDVTLSVQKGEIVALTGPSGSGKSTLMHLIGGLDRPTSGELVVQGQSLHELREGQLAKYRNHSVGFVFQFFYLQPFLSMSRNVELPLMFAKTPRKNRQTAISSVVDAVSISDRLTFLPKELSGGQMQRVAIARALVNKPSILLADEPTGNLDSKNSEAIMRLLQTMRDTLGTTMIIVTHDPSVASWADRSIRLEDGRVAA